jgi:actin-related protein
VAGYALPHAFEKVRLGGSHISEHLRELLLRSNPDVTPHHDVYAIESQIKETSSCFVALNYADELKRVQQSSAPKLVELYRPMTDIVDTFKISSEFFECCEPFFNPSLYKGNSKISSYDLATHILRTVQKCDVDIRRDLAKNIVLSGGSSLFSGMAERLQAELKQLAPNLDWIVMRPKEARYSTWIGGSILGSLSTFSKMWISRPEYEESGMFATLKRCNYDVSLTR